MRIALADLRLDGLVVLYPGKVRYGLGDRVEAVSITTLAEGGGKALWGRLGKTRGGLR